MSLKIISWDYYSLQQVLEKAVFDKSPILVDKDKGAQRKSETNGKAIERLQKQT